MSHIILVRRSIVNGIAKFTITHPMTPIKTKTIACKSNQGTNYAFTEYNYVRRGGYSV
jgi:hypothetical protein